MEKEIKDNEFMNEEIKDNEFLDEETKEDGKPIAFDMNEVLYVPVDKIQGKSFITPNVCECVVGILRVKNQENKTVGFFLMHKYLQNRSDEIAEFIHRKVDSGNNIDLCTYGGSNFGLVLPRSKQEMTEEERLKYKQNFYESDLAYPINPRHKQRIIDVINPPKNSFFQITSEKIDTINQFNIRLLNGKTTEELQEQESSGNTTPVASDIKQYKDIEYRDPRLDPSLCNIKNIVKAPLTFDHFAGNKNIRHIVSAIKKSGNKISSHEHFYHSKLSQTFTINFNDNINANINDNTDSFEINSRETNIFRDYAALNDKHRKINPSVSKITLSTSDVLDR